MISGNQLSHRGHHVRDVQIHLLITFVSRVVLHKARASTFDLNTASSFLLDVLDIRAALANDLSTEIEARDGFEIDRNLLFWPLALPNVNIAHYVCVSSLLTRPLSSLSNCSGSRRRNLRSSMRFGKSCCIIWSISATAFSSPSLVVLVM